MPTLTKISQRDHGREMSLDDFIGCGDTYTTSLLPGFPLIVDPRV